MDEKEKLNLDSAAGDEIANTDSMGDAIEGIRNLVENQPYGILCTQTEGQPYGSLVGLAFTSDLKHVVFSTPRATRKYNNLTECSRVAIVVNNLDKFPDELMKVSAFTVTGQAREVSSDGDGAEPAALLAQRHPELKGFIESPSTAVFVVEVIRFFFVRSFQKVSQWSPSEADE